MPFDLDNDRTPPPPPPLAPPPAAGDDDEDAPPARVPVPLESISDYLEKLRAQGKVDHSEAPLARSGLQQARRHYTFVDERPWALPGVTDSSPRRGGNISWRHDLFTHRAAPQRVLMTYAPGHVQLSHAIRDNRPLDRLSEAIPTMVFGHLTPTTTVGDLRQLVWSRLLPGPTTAIVISSWGRVLDDPRKTLLQNDLTGDAKLEVRFVERDLPADRGLTRVRLCSTALATRVIDVEANATGMDLKRLVEGALARRQYEWYDHNGDPIVCNNGVTLVAVETREYEENGGTDAVRAGEELIMDVMKKGMLSTGKGSVMAHRMTTGEVCNIADPMVAFLDLKAERSIKLSYAGKEVLDDERLWKLGVRTDDAIDLEFESPALPEILKLLRGPDPPAKGGGKKKK